MKKLKKTIIIFGAVAIALIMVSGATGTNVLQTAQIKKVESELQNNDLDLRLSSSFGIDTKNTMDSQSQQNQNSVNNANNHVKPGIYLSGKQKLFLRAALKFVDDPDVRLLLEQIIRKIELKGYVDSSDIAQIISDNNLELGTITSGFIETGDDNSRLCGGGFFCPRHPLNLISAILPVCFYWRAFVDMMSHPVKITIDGVYITYENQGWAIAFSGLLSNAFFWRGMEIWGIAALIIYKPL